MRYDDIISLPHHVSQKHPPMSMTDRAAQFSPFAALTGYEDAIDEAARMTEAQIELDDNEREGIDRILRDAYERGYPVKITHFVPDHLKDGGEYVITTGIIKMLDPVNSSIELQGKRVVHIFDIQSVKRDENSNLECRTAQA